MLRFGPMVAAATLLLSADVSGVIHLLPPANQRVEFPPSENLPVLPDMSPEMTTANDQDHAAQDNAPDTKSGKNKDEPLKPESRFALLRYLDFELVRVVE